MKELEKFINSYFGIIQPNELKKISSLFKLITLKKGDYFLLAGKQCDKFCFIETGLMRVFAITDGKEITQWISTKGYFGTDFTSFFFESPSQWTIQALVDTELYTITRNDYKKISSIVSHWNELEKIFIIKCFKILEDRIFNFLSLSAEERYNLFFENNKELFNQVHLQYIASMLGMTPETFSRIRRKQLN